MIHLVSIELHRTTVSTRMPFRYGIATMTRLPHVFLSVVVEIDGRAQQGISADHLPPKWFTKDPARDLEGEIEEMIGVIRRAMDTAMQIRAPSVFAFWRELYDAQARWAADNSLAPLLAHFGTSLVERALLDAYARFHGLPFHRLVAGDWLGLDLASIHPGLSGTRARDWLPSAPLDQIVVRHTVGLSDPLTKAEVPSAEALDDGLPQALDECIAAYGLRHFKLKIAGQRAADLDRLERVERVITRHAPPDFRFTLDGNEGFGNVAALREFWEEMTSRPALRRFLQHLLFVEQPFHRRIALTAEVGEFAREWPRRPPIIIDESDAELSSLGTALALGYAGTSHKNCKGIFKGIANACRLAQLRRTRPAETFLLSGEDLSNIGPVALLQDLAVQSVLGVASVERNGHHYFAGLSFWPEEWQTAMLRDHGDLYVRSKAGWPRLNVHVGRIDLATVNAAPFGLAALPALSALPAPSLIHAG